MPDDGESLVGVTEVYYVNSSNSLDYHADH